MSKQFILHHAYFMAYTRKRFLDPLYVSRNLIETDSAVC